MSYPRASAHIPSQDGLVNYALEATAAWHRAFGVPQHAFDGQTFVKRFILQMDEQLETLKAAIDRDMEEWIDGWCDELFVSAGTVDALNPVMHSAIFEKLRTPAQLVGGQTQRLQIPVILLMQAFEEVVRCNFFKLWTIDECGQEGELHSRKPSWTASEAPGQPGLFVVRDAMGKIRKPPSWTGPDHAFVAAEIAKLDTVIWPLNAEEAEALAVKQEAQRAEEDEAAACLHLMAQEAQRTNEEEHGHNQQDANGVCG